MWVTRPGRGDITTSLDPTAYALSAYYLKGVEPSWELIDIYRGMMPFMALQCLGVTLVYFFPQIVLWLPNVLFGK